MIRTLIFKDCRLMRTYIRLAAIATIVGYVASAIFTVYVTAEFREPELRTGAARALLSLKTGLWLGILSTGMLGTLLGASVFTQERADRSAEFLACLPPTRWQHLISKLSVSLGVTILMILVNLGAVAAIHFLVPYARTNIAQLNHELSAPIPITLSLWFGAIFSMYSGALAISVWTKTNGVPILCGLITPIVLFALRILVSFWLQVPYTGSEFQMAFAATCWVLSSLLIFLACYWYLLRWEP